MPKLFLDSLPNGACCSRTEAVEATQTTSSRRSRASQRAGGPQARSSTQSNSTVGFFLTFGPWDGGESENCVAGGLKPRKAICNHPINRGGCQVNILSHQLAIIEHLKFRQSFVDSTLTHAQKPVNSLSLVVVKVTLILLLFSTAGALVVKTV